MAPWFEWPRFPNRGGGANRTKIQPRNNSVFPYKTIYLSFTAALEHLSSVPSFSQQFKAEKLPWSVKKLKDSDMQRQTCGNEESNLLAPPKRDRLKPSAPRLFQAPVNPNHCIQASTPEFKSVKTSLRPAQPAQQELSLYLKAKVICLQFLTAALAAGVLMLPPHAEHPGSFGFFLVYYPQQVRWQE